MKYHNWNNDKNKKLKDERKISFEDILFYIEHGHLVSIVEHPNKDKYENQKMYVIDINGYIYLVPFVENDHEIFMKTIIPSRNATKQYLKGDK